jgi:hypothetical protein
MHEILNHNRYRTGQTSPTRSYKPRGTPQKCSKTLRHLLSFSFTGPGIPRASRHPNEATSYIQIQIIQSTMLPRRARSINRSRSTACSDQARIEMEPGKGERGAMPVPRQWGCLGCRRSGAPSRTGSWPPSPKLPEET